ncbi:hypothetical protein P7K49_034722 [Saguinus oedipus]|uniref:Uncharacterized protein n=1 Tax=Saguinus oedipus TaxID=9490 RepID=A0ABQ9TWF0_SAGOE|nr:hypothetical protein P7K49_034722 [Saguinus oedipus]
MCSDGQMFPEGKQHIDPEKPSEVYVDAQQIFAARAYPVQKPAHIGRAKCPDAQAPGGHCLNGQ